MLNQQGLLGEAQEDGAPARVSQEHGVHVVHQVLPLLACSALVVWNVQHAEGRVESTRAAGTLAGKGYSKSWPNT